MVASLTGTPEVVAWTAGVADPAGQSITIPGDATAVYMFWSFYDGSAGQGLSTATLNGNAADELIELPGTLFEFPAGGVAAWYNPSTGSQTLDVAWDAAPGATDGGPLTTVAYVLGGDTGGWRDAGVDQDLTAATVTLTTTTTDFVLKFDVRYSGGTPPGLPGTSTGWTSRQTQDRNQLGSRLSSADSPGASTTVCNSEDESYTTLVAISIIEAPGLLPPNSLCLSGVGR